MTDAASDTAEDTTEWGYTAKDIANNHTRDGIVNGGDSARYSGEHSKSYSGEYVVVLAPEIHGKRHLKAKCRALCWQVSGPPTASIRLSCTTGQSVSIFNYYHCQHYCIVIAIAKNRAASAQIVQ